MIEMMPIVLPGDTPRDVTSFDLPLEFFRAHEAQARENCHGRSLERIAERGGLGAAEALAVLEDRPWQHIPWEQAEIRVRALFDEWRTK